MIELSVELGRPAKALENEPRVPDDLEGYFYAYFELKRRASSFGGTITWSDLIAFHDRVAKHLNFHLFLDVINLLEHEDDLIQEEKSHRGRSR